MTYAQVDEQSDVLAANLRALVQGECIVAIFLPRDSHHLYVAQLAVMKAGAAYTCLDPSFPDEHCRFILEDTSAVALLSNRDSLGRASSLGICGCPVLDMDKLIDRKTAASQSPPPWLEPSSLAYVIYTSGTTGHPKGVMIEHGSVANLVGSDVERYRLTPEDRVSQNSSASYDSSVEEIWLAFAVGATLVVMDDEDVRLGPDLVQWLRREAITVLCPSPTMLRTTGCADPEGELPDLGLVYSGGEALPRDLADRWAPGRWLENGYGPTECTVTVLRERVRQKEPVTIGRPLRGNHAWVLDASGQEVPDGEEGELCIGGTGLARGYLNRPELTEEKFPTHPRLGRIYHTGDLVRRDQRGDYFFLGRIDSQVKLRGYRIELEEIESHLVQCQGVREAACRIQGDGVDRLLVAFVVPQQMAAPPCFDELEARLRDAMPAYMVPSRFGLLARLPTTVGGKLDRKALPELGMPERLSEREIVAPRNGIESIIAEIFCSALGLSGSLSIHDDFFKDLGGDSLAAAVTISNLRNDERTAGLTVRDLYGARTVSGLAERACLPTSTSAPVAEELARPEGNRPLAGAIQGAWILVGLLLGAGAAYFASFILIPFMLRGLGLITFILLVPLFAWASLAVYTPLSVWLAAILKRLLIGRYREMTAPVWGSLYIRNWMVQQVVRIIPWSLIQGTVFTSWALRMLGAKVGKRVHIHRGVNLTQGGWDLLEIGDDVTICQDASIRLVDIRDRQIIVEPVKIGAGATIDIRAGVSGHSTLGQGTYLTAMSWLRFGDVIPDAERWDGIPAAPAGLAPEPTPLSGDNRVFSPGWHGILLIFARFGVGVLLAIPFIALTIGLILAFDLDGEGVLAWLFGPSFSATVMVPLVLAVVLVTPFSLVLQAAFMRLLGTIRPGVISRWSLGYIRIWLKAGMVDTAGGWLNGTLFWPGWLRLAGMTIGKKSEISTIIDVPPECVEIGEESFFADGVYLGCPGIHRNTVTVAPTRLGRNTFIGNHAIVHAGQQLPGDLLLGVCTVADDQVVRRKSSWFGHPPFELPRGEPVTYDRRLTHDPSLIRLVTRLFWESFRFLLPIVPLLSMLAWFKGLDALAGGASRAVYLVCIVPGLACALAVGFCLLVLLIKWTLLGRVTPGQHPFWCCWCSRWDFLYVAWSYYARRILSVFEGTPFLHWYLRAMGAKVGRGVVLGSAFAQVVDPDMLEFQDGATVNCLFQAHSFEDRVLKIGHVKVGREATVNSGALLFYGTDVGTRTWVGPHSVVMKHERLLPATYYVGCPTRPQ